ncbi:MAG: MATE family efflux transporter [Chloroflexia bacterium]
MPREKRPLDLRPEQLTRTVLTLAAPAVVENLLVTAVFFADTLLIGWLHDDTALAAVGLGSTVMFTANGLFEALAVSATALVARSWGEGDFQQAGRVAGQALVLSLLLSVVLAALLIPLAEGFLSLLGAEAAVAQAGGLYLRLILSTSFLSFPLMVANGILRGAGDTRTPMWLTLAMNVWNVAAATVLVFGLGPIPALGLAGAGVATASARALGGGLGLLVLLRGWSVVQVRPSALARWDGRLVRRIVRLGLPNLGETIISRLGYLAFMSIVTHLGTIPLAAHQLALRVESLSFMPGWGLSVAAATLAGQALGAGSPEVAETGIRRTLLMALTLTGAIGILYAALGPQIVTIFGSTPEVLEQAGLAVRIAAAEQPFLAAQMVLAGGLRGAGDTRTPMWVSLFGVAGLRLVVVYLFAVVLDWGLAGVWWGTAVDWAGRSALIWALFRRGWWKEVRV